MEIPAPEIDSVKKRLARAQGQLGGIIKMLEEGRECTDVLTQLAAANSAISKALRFPLHRLRHRKLRVTGEEGES